MKKINENQTKITSNSTISFWVYDGYLNRSKHWFVCNEIQRAQLVDDEYRQLAKFGVPLRVGALDCFMNHSQSLQYLSKSEVKNQLRWTFHYTMGHHIAPQKFKEIQQHLTGCVLDYDSSCRDLLSQIPMY